MAKTNANLQVETRIYLDESSQVDFLDTEVQIAVNRAYHDVVSRVMGVYERYYETTTPYTYAIVADQQEYTIASSLIKVTRVEINYNPNVSGSTAARALPINEDEIRGNLANTNNAGSFFSAGYYLHGNIGAQKIGFVPVPTIADTVSQSISVWGIDLPSDLSASGDNVNIPYADRFAYLISLRAAAQLLRKGQQEENAAQTYLADYRAGIKEMEDFLKDRQEDDGVYIIDSTLDNIDFSDQSVI